MKAMAPNPDNRYPSADAMLADLEEFRKNPNINFDFSPNDFHPEEEEDVDRTQIHTVPPRTSSGRRETPVSRTERQDRRARRIEEEEEDEEEERRGPQLAGDRRGGCHSGVCSRSGLHHVLHGLFRQLPGWEHQAGYLR